MSVDFIAIFRESTQLSAVFSSTEAFGATFGEVYRSGEYEVYEGPTEVTPSQETQVLETEGKAVLVDITINPIPSNYGLITYNGSILTVS